MPSSKKRPLSPHLQVYRWQITNTLSIFHRLTGIGLCFSLVFLVAWLGCLALSIDAYNGFMSLFHSFVGQFIFIMSLLGLYYHLANGIRHLAWDAGYGFSLKVTTITGWLVVIFSFLATLLTWMAV